MLQYVTAETLTLSGGTRPRSVFRNIDYQSVAKHSVETRPKNVDVSTLPPKTYLTTNKLQDHPWPRPDSPQKSSVNV